MTSLMAEAYAAKYVIPPLAPGNRSDHLHARNIYDTNSVLLPIAPVVQLVTSKPSDVGT